MFLRVMCNVIILPFIHVITNDKKQQKIEKIKSCMNGFILLKCARTIRLFFLKAFPYV